MLLPFQAIAISALLLGSLGSAAALAADVSPSGSSSHLQVDALVAEVLQKNPGLAALEAAIREAAARVTSARWTTQYFPTRPRRALSARASAIATMCNSVRPSPGLALERAADQGQAIADPVLQGLEQENQRNQNQPPREGRHLLLYTGVKRERHGIREGHSVEIGVPWIDKHIVLARYDY